MNIYPQNSHNLGRINDRLQLLEQPTRGRVGFSQAGKATLFGWNVSSPFCAGT
jgi:hypothetical protein